MPAVRKTVPLSPFAERILTHLVESLHERAGTLETQVLTEAVTHGLTTMLPRAWQANEHQWGGMPLEHLITELISLVRPILSFLADHDAVDELLRPYLRLITPMEFHPAVSPIAAPPPPPTDPIREQMAEAVNDLADLGFTMDFGD